MLRPGERAIHGSEIFDGLPNSYVLAVKPNRSRETELTQRKRQARGEFALGFDDLVGIDGRLTMDFSRELFKEGVLGTGIAFPTVPEGKARIRTIMTATHTRQQLDQALETLKRVGKRLGILI